MDAPGLGVPDQKFARNFLEKIVLTVNFFEVDQLLHRNPGTDFVLLFNRFDDEFRPGEHVLSVLVKFNRIFVVKPTGLKIESRDLPCVDFWHPLFARIIPH